MEVNFEPTNKAETDRQAAAESERIDAAKAAFDADMLKTMRENNTLAFPDAPAPAANPNLSEGENGFILDMHRMGGFGGVNNPAK